MTMKIALVTRRYPPLIGGAERVLSYLAPALASEGAEVVVLTARPEGVAAFEVVSAGCRVERLATSQARFVGTYLYMRELSRWFARNRVDLAYVSMLKHDAYVAVGEGRRRGFPVVLRPEGAGATGDLAWQSWGRFGRTIGRRCRQADAVVAISSAVRDELLGAGYDPSSVVDLPNGVPVPERPWRPRPGRWQVGSMSPALSPLVGERAVSRTGTQPWPGPSHSLVVTFVGRLAPEKGLDTLVDAWPIVLASHPTARLILIGEGPERRRLEARIALRGLLGTVELIGAWPDPSTTLRGADLFVLPSREEGMSIALLEAMALGIPSVASAIPGNLALMTDREHGRLVPPDDPPALARAILEHRADPDALKMAEAARRRVFERYSIASVARRHLELFARLVAGERMG